MDTSAFAQWYSAERERRNGRPAARETLKAKCSRLRSVAAVVGTNDVPSLVRALEERACVVAALDALRVTLAPNSLRMTVHALRSLDEYARATELSDGLAIRKGDAPPSRARGPVTVYDRSDLDRILAATAHDTRWHLFVLVLMDTGMRIGEVLSLQWAHLHPTSTPPFAELPTTKTGAPRLVPLSSRVVHALTPDVEAKLRAERRPNRWRAREYKKDPTVYVFPFVYSTAQQRLRRTCERAGVPYRAAHHFRHTFATRLLVRGVDILPVSRLLGHTSIGITAAYYSHATALEYAHLVAGGV